MLWTIPAIATSSRSGVVTYGPVFDSVPGKYGYSLRKLKTGATVAIRVNRSSDSTEQDIGFDGNGDFDIASYNTFVGGGTGRIMKWYDQSGNGNHLLTNGITSEVPVFDGAAMGSRYALKWDGANDAMYSTNNPFFASATAASVFQVFKLPGDPNADVSGNKSGPFFVCNGFAGVDNHLPWTDGVIYDGTFSTSRKTVGDPTPSMTNPTLISILSGASDWRFYFNNASLFSTSTNTFDTGAGHTGVAWIGVTTVSFRWFPGWGSEILVYDSALSDTDRNTVSANVNNYYTIY